MPKKIRPRVPVCLVHVRTCAIMLVLVCGIMYHIEKDCLGFSAGYQRAPGTSEKKKNAWYQRELRRQLRGRPFHPWAGRFRFSGEAHPGPATFTQSSSFSCGAGLQSESRLLLCCAPAVYMLADAAPVAAAVFGLEHLISYCNYTKRSFGPTSRGQGRRLCHAMPNYRPGEVPEAAASLLLPVSL